MSLRSIVGILLVCAALVSPWLVDDWILVEQAGEETPQRRVSVPDLGDPERRKFNALPSRESQPSPNQGPLKSRRTVGEGGVKRFSTSAKAILRGDRVKQVPQSDKSIMAAARHSERIRREMGRLGLSMGNPVYCRIFKEEKEFELWIQPRGKSEYSLFKVYRICKTSGGVGPKARSGDRQAPEGFYFVTPGRMIAETRFHLGFDLGYPNLHDRFHGRTGANILVHGKCIAEGSYSLTDGAIEEVYTIASAAFKGGQNFFRVHCFPFRMDDKRMDPKIGMHPENDQFWANLKEGYDFFETLRFPPDVTIAQDGSYQFAVK